MPFISVTFNGQSRWFRKSASGVPANSFVRLQVSRAMGVSTSEVSTSPEHPGPFPEFATTFTGLAQSLMVGPLTDALGETDRQFGSIDAPNFSTPPTPEVITAVPELPVYGDVFRFLWRGERIQVRKVLNRPESFSSFEITRNGTLSGFVTSSQLNLVFVGWRTTRGASYAEAAELHASGFGVDLIVDTGQTILNPFEWLGWNPVSATGEIVGDAADVVSGAVGGIGDAIGDIGTSIGSVARTAVSFAPSMMMIVMLMVMSKGDKR